MRQSKPFVFMENKGQLSDENGNVLKDISYYACQNGVNIYCKKDRIAFVFTKIEKSSDTTEALPKSIPANGKSDIAYLRSKHDLHASLSVPRTSKITAARMEMEFLNTNPETQTMQEEPDAYYENFYLPQCKDGITATGFKKLTYKNLWPNIDLVLQTNIGTKQGMEYSFVVNPGGNINDIQIQWNGADSMSGVGKGEGAGLHLVNSLGTIDETGLKSYLKGEEKAIETNYVFNKNRAFGFEVGDYDKNRVLVIDPTLVWGTYFGGSGVDVATCLSLDATGNIYITGSTSSKTGIATSGAYQTTKNSGYFDAYLAKFSISGNVIWATYYGANDYVEAYKVNTDAAGNAYIVGWTQSNKGIATAGAYQTTYGGGNSDAFLTKFSGKGKLLWATYFGGNGRDVAISASIDVLDNIYVSGYTQSSSGIATTGDFQSFLGGGTDAFLAKFSSSGNLSWATYYGGIGSDEASDVTTDTYGNIYMTGITESSDRISTSGAYQTSNKGSSEAFLAKFSRSGKLLWATYYGGTDYNNGLGICSDLQGNVYVVGNTSSDNGIATSGAFQTSLNGNYDGFLAKFGSSGSLIWGSYFGGAAADEVLSVCTDSFGSIYMTGFTKSETNIATSSAYQTSNLGANAFLAKFSNIGFLDWATYYGGNVVDMAHGIKTDNSYNVYITGYTTSSNAITTSHAYQVTYSGDSDAFLAKFNFKIKYDAGIKSIQNPSENFCKAQKPVQVKLKNYGEGELDSVKINWSINRKIQPQYNWSGKLATDSTAAVTLGNYNFNPGTDTIKAWTSLPDGYKDSVPENDSAKIIDSVFDLPKAKIASTQSICPGAVLFLGDTAVAGNTYSWTSNRPFFNSTSSNPAVSPDSTTTYYLTETNTATGCSKTSSTTISLVPLSSGTAGGNHTICEGTRIRLGSNIHYQREKFYWTLKNDSIFSNIDFPIVSPIGTTTYYLHIALPFSSCYKIDSAIIRVIPKPASFYQHDLSICAGSNLKLGNPIIKGNSYLWTSQPSGYTSNISNPIVSPSKATTYFLTETNDSFGCQYNDSVNITVNPLPKPNAGKDQWICPGTRVTLGSNNMVQTDSFQWASFPSGFQSQVAQPTDIPMATGKYILTETIPATHCAARDTVNVFVYPKPSPAIAGKNNLCGNDPVSFSIDNNAGDIMKWSTDNAKIISGTDSSTVWIKPEYGADTISIKETNSYGCSGSAKTILEVHPNPNAYFRLASDSPSYIFKAIDSTEPVYLWSLGDGMQGNNYNVTHKYLFNKDSIVTISLAATSVFGCTSIFDSTIRIHYIAPDHFNIKVYPNPFEFDTRIMIDLEKSAHIQIMIYDAIGRLIGKLADVQQPIGKHNYDWNSGPEISAGIYLVKIIIDGKVYVKPVVRMYR